MKIVIELTLCERGDVRLTGDNEQQQEIELHKQGHATVVPLLHGQTKNATAICRIFFVSVLFVVVFVVHATTTRLLASFLLTVTEARKTRK